MVSDVLLARAGSFSSSTGECGMLSPFRGKAQLQHLQFMIFDIVFL